MARDAQATRRKILDAATEEFVAHGPDGTTMERIARRAGINKERVYNYFGSKPGLFAQVLREQLAEGTGAVPLNATDAESLGDFAGRMFDYNLHHPQHVRLLMWEALSFGEEVPEESQRREVYASRTEAIAAGQTHGTVSGSISARSLYFQLLALAGYSAVMPQVARMVTGSTDDADSLARYRAEVVEAARRLAAVQ
ncbi:MULTISPECIES: TetR family transcriptional regulator [unclassified Actinomyces]|uniref:TetR/AcrR family transcriptional regulator n=1 Tax=unclassified Actinomyces TaxID=2609248 RepID=UPI0013A6D408|nr:MULTISPECIES: TetR family transcriptional regulator [unclassified Actinomyces]MBW3069374.1 TetR/AcrR family transcriptional regulator [Actinomyces sp. 594]NDR53747.1 TetR/AcrR family transcriptional regulator [Actinomyces sp. 565]